jgi:hypothetical protein
MQRSQSKILRMITNAPWYVTNKILHDDLKVPFIKVVIQEKCINYHDKLGNHSNPILQPLLEQQQRRRLMKLWPAQLIDGWRGFTHWKGPHQGIESTGGRCLTQHISLLIRANRQNCFMCWVFLTDIVSINVLNNTCLFIKIILILNWLQ